MWPRSIAVGSTNILACWEHPVPLQFAIPILPQIWGAGGSRALERAGSKTHSDGRIMFLATERSAPGRPGVEVVKRGYGGSSNASSIDDASRITHHSSLNLRESSSPAAN